MENHYNVHNLVKIRVNNKNPYLHEELDHSVRYFKVPGPLDGYAMEIGHISQFSLPEGAFNVSGSMFGFRGGIYDKKEEYALEVVGDVIRLYVKENNVGINALMEYLLLAKGHTFIHGAGVSYKNAGIVFPAPPNTGKTTLMAKLRENPRIKFFGDDYVLVSSDGVMRAYPMDFSIHDYHFNFYRELQKAPEGKKIKRMAYEKFLVDLVRNFPIRRQLKHLARLLGYDFLKGGEYLKVPATQLIAREKIGDHVPLRFCVCLNKYNGSELKTERISQEVVIREIIGTLMDEWRKTMPAYHALASFGIIDFADFVGRIKAVLGGALAHLDYYRVYLPEHMDHQERFKQLEAFLTKEVFGRIP